MKTRFSFRSMLIIVIISVVLTASFFYAFAATPTSTFYISGGIYSGAPSYTIWKESTNYFAKDASGEIDYSGTNASELTQNCIDQLTSGGLIFFKTGLYDFDTQVDVSYSIVFIGEGIIHTEIRVTTADIYLFNVTANYVSFKDIYFNGNSKTGYGITFRAGANFVKVESCNFYNCKRAIVVYGNYGTNILGRILYNTFWTCDYGITINSLSGYWTNDWVIIGNRFQNMAAQAIQIGVGNGMGTGVRITHNTIENSPTGIRLGNNSHYARVHYNRVENCTSYGIYIINAPNNVHISHNYFADANITVSSIGSNHYIAYNDGNLDYVSYHEYFTGTSAPTHPTPVEGNLFYDTDDDKLYWYNGTHWNEIS